MEKRKNSRITALSVAFIILSSCYAMADPIMSPWHVVVNNSFIVPGDTRNFNSYNQPSLSMDGFVVFRARSKGGTGGEPAHGVFTRDMSIGTPLITMFDRNSAVPWPNNLNQTFVEPPSFPRIDMQSHTIASRGNHPPLWRYLLDDGTETRAGTTGIYTDPFHVLITGESNLGAVPDFPFFSVPGAVGVKFDVFPGAPAVTDRSTIVFKGNYTVPDPHNLDETIGKTGVYYRDLLPGPTGGTTGAVLIANSDTRIPGSRRSFGSTAPPSAAGRRAVFAGFDNEDAPTLGGIYLARLNGSSPPLDRLIAIGEQVPGEAEGAVFNKLGEGVSYDGRFVAFWGAWGTETRTITLQCPTDGNRGLIEYCHEQYPDGYTTTVPIHQGIFVHDVQTRITTPIAKAPQDFNDYLFWNFSGKVPGSSEDGEPARWRSASFVAVSGMADGNSSDATFDAVFKATSGAVQPDEDRIDGLYLHTAPGNFPIVTLVETGMDGTLIDPAAIDPETQTHLPVTAMGIERDGFRGKWLAITVSAGTEQAGWAGIYTRNICGLPPVATDFNHDCSPDLVLLKPTTRQTAAWFLNNNSFVASAYGATLPANWNLVGTDDFDRDGNVDYVLFNATTGRTAIWYLNGTNYTSAAFGPIVPAGWALTTLGDFNGDGHSDYVLYKATTRQTAIWFLNNNTYIGSSFGPTLPLNWSIVGVADFNRDGQLDYALYNSTTQRTGIWYLNGTTYKSAAAGPPIVAGYELSGIGDFNANGAPDFLLFKPATRQTAIWYLDNNFFVGSAYGPQLPSGWIMAVP